MPLPYAEYSAVGLVNKGWEFFQGKASEMLWKVESSLNSIAYPLWDLQAPVIAYDPPVLEAGTFLRPEAPEAPELPAIDTSVPAAPELDSIALDTLPAAPVEPDFSGMAYRPPAEPNIAAPTRPTDTDVALLDIEVPDAPVFVLPDEPELYALDLPEIPDLTIPEFAGVRPTMNLQAPTQGLNWAYQAYDRTHVESIRDQLGTMRIDGLALPAAIEQAIFDRARGREDVLSLQQEQEAILLAQGRQVFRLPLLPEGTDAGGIRVLADALTDQGMI